MEKPESDRPTSLNEQLLMQPQGYSQLREIMMGKIERTARADSAGWPGPRGARGVTESQRPSLEVNAETGLTLSSASAVLLATNT